MTQTPTDKETADKVELLLPWYATGRLSPDEKSRVASALDRDPALRRQLGLIEDEIEATRADHEAIRVPGTLTAANLVTRAGLAPSGGAKPGRLQIVRDAMAALWTGPARYVTAAALLLILGQSLVVGVLLHEQQSSRFHLATGQRPLEGALVLVRFAEAATSREISNYLLAEGFLIVDGPKADGIYSIRIGDRKLSPAERQQRLDRLTAMTGIVSFAVPSN